MSISKIRFENNRENEHGNDERCLLRVVLKFADGIGLLVRIQTSVS